MEPTPITLTEFMIRCGTVRHRPKIVCMDGFKMSVQGNEMAYSIPRKTGPQFSAMEIGFPSEPEDLIITYADNPADPTGTVYGYIPMKLIEQVVLKHGGINADVTFEDF
jgi:hypothetical protein